MERDISFIEKARRYEESLGKSLKENERILGQYGERHIVPVLEVVGSASLKAGLRVAAIYGIITVVSVARSDDPIQELVHIYKQLF